jgi:hypothetical protein
MAKKSVASNASATRKAAKYSMDWAKAMMTCFGKSAISAINLPAACWYLKRLNGVNHRPDVKLVDAFPQLVFWV